MVPCEEEGCSGCDTPRTAGVVVGGAPERETDSFLTWCSKSSSSFSTAKELMSSSVGGKVRGARSGGQGQGGKVREARSGGQGQGGKVRESVDCDN